MVPSSQDEVRSHPASAIGFLVVAPEDLVGITEIAETLGVAKVTAKRYASRADFPEPVGRLGGRIRVWRRRDVLKWAERTLPLPRPGRPRKTE
jgi:predicted DNA-binding transcriptional regulator AlpA